MTLFRSLALTALFLVFFIPGFSDAQILCRSSVGGHCVNLAAAGTVPGLEFLGEIETPSALFSKIYTFGVSFVGLAAFFMFTYGAIRYMTAGEGSPSEARKIMYNAIFGLVLALVSFLILKIINPELVSGFNIALPKIEGLKAPESSPSTESGGAGPNTQYIGKDLGAAAVEAARKACEEAGGKFTEFTDFSGTSYTCLHL